MSTSSKIMENQMQTIKCSPKKSLNITCSPQLTPRSKDDSSQSDYQSFDREGLLELEIKQMKRENKFLKKKISDLLAERNGDFPKKKKTKKGADKEDKETLHQTIDFFFDEINSLIKSLTELFKIEFTHDEVQEFSKRFPEQDNLPENKKFAALKKFQINRKLQKIMLESDEKKYAMLLETFTTYYRSKEECDQHIRSVVDKLTAKAQDLSKIILDKAQKKSQLKSSAIRSHISLNETKNIKISLPLTYSKFGLTGSDGEEDTIKKHHK